MKLPLREPELDPLAEELAVGWPRGKRSARVEAIRARSRYGEQYERAARDFLEVVVILPLDDDVLDEAVALHPAQLRSLDALHSATALAVREEIGVFVTYDQQLAGAASAQGPAVVAPT